ncbi:MAG: PEGA domain-containing protein [Planctomycetes bacterium]|nr:PEGA domain-containing protein [Planctomycetota bacterium]
MVGLSDQIAADLGTGDLNRADTRLSEARTQAAGDLAALAEVDVLAKRVHDAIERQVTTVAAQVDAGELAPARQAFDRLPQARVPADLSARLVKAERERDSRAQVMVVQIERLLEDNRIEQALAAMDTADARETAAAREVLDRWRVLGLEQASLSGTAPARREALIVALKQSRPSPLQQEQIDRIAKDLERTFGRNREQLRGLQAQLAQGAWQEAKAEAERLRLIDDSASGPEVAAFLTELDRVGGELEGIYADACAAVRDAVDGEGFPAVRTRIDNALTAYPQASNRSALTALAQSLEVIAPALGRGTLAEEAGQFRAWVADSQVDDGVAAAIAARVQRLAQADADARAALEYTRRLASDGKWSEAIEALESLRTRNDWRRASAWTAAAEDLVAARANLARAGENQRRFESALAKGDVASAHEIARELGMRTLPLWIESIPVGAEVSRDGKAIGVTPMMLEISGSERGELVLGLSAPGYEERQVSGGDAQQGWRLAVELVRSASARCDARMIVSGRPAAAGGQLWLVGPSQVARVALDGQVAAFPLEGTAFNSGAVARRLSEPVYAPPTALDDGVYVATRDMIALRVDGRAVTRLPLATRSDHALAAYASAILDHRRWLIAAGTDGAVHGNDPLVADAVWHGPTGAAFACGPVVVGDTVLVARVDGTLQALDADNGRLAHETSCGEPIVVAWGDGDGMAGIGRTRAWRWNADGVASEPLPKEAVLASRGIFITADRHAWVKGEGGWKDVGQLPAQPTAPPCAWRGHAAVPIGRDVHVIGAHGFVVRGEADMLSPVDVDGHLAVVSVDGHVALYAP